MIQDLVNNFGYSAVGLDTSRICDFVQCEFSVVGVPDHSICSLSGAVGANQFTHTSSGVFVSQTEIRWDWVLVIGDDIDMPQFTGNSFSIQVQCGQGVVAAQ